MIIPMLAKHWNENKFNSYPCYVQPKVDGLRAMWYNGKLYSRDNARVKRTTTRELPKEWAESRLPHIYEALRKKFPDVNVDGEIYRHGWSLQRINSVGGVNSTKTDPNHRELELWVFDVIVPQVKQSDRIAWLQNSFGFPQNLVLVPTFTATNREFLDEAHKWFQAQGYEGSMIRKADANYGFEQNCSNQENRWDCILKRKDWLDQVCDVVGRTEGNGKYVGMVGALQLRLPINGVIFDAGTGLTDEQRTRYYTQLPTSARVAFKCLTDGGYPREPKIECVYD